jgi:glutathione S-transferase
VLVCCLAVPLWRGVTTYLRKVTYLYVMTRWLSYTGVALDEFPLVQRHFERQRDDPAVERAEREEGIRG